MRNMSSGTRCIVHITINFVTKGNVFYQRPLLYILKNTRSATNVRNLLRTLKKSHSLGKNLSNRLATSTAARYLTLIIDGVFLSIYSNGHSRR